MSTYIYIAAAIVLALLIAYRVYKHVKTYHIDEALFASVNGETSNEQPQESDSSSDTEDKPVSVQEQDLKPEETTPEHKIVVDEPAIIPVSTNSGRIYVAAPKPTKKSSSTKKSSTKESASTKKTVKKNEKKVESTAPKTSAKKEIVKSTAKNTATKTETAPKKRGRKPKAN